MAVAAAAAAFTTWRRVDAGERAGHLRALADAMEGAAGELVGLHQESAATSAARQAATMVGSVVLSGGMAGAVTIANRCYLVLTDRRLLFFETTPRAGRPRRELAAELPRAELRARPARSLVYRTYHLTTVDGSPVLRLSFPLPTRRDGEQLARELSSVSSGAM
jgi:Aldehyde dehydrogenase family